MEIFLETFLIVAAVIFFIFGSLLLLSPVTVEKICNLLNQVLFTVDNKIHTLRRPLGIVLLGLTILLWYIVLWG